MRHPVCHRRVRRVAPVTLGRVPPCGAARARPRLGGCVLAAVALLFGAPGVRAQAAPRRAAVFFAPLRVDRAFAPQERLLRETLGAQMVATGAFAETVTAETEAVWQQCVRDVNRESNTETCWVRLGQGQGADLMVSGDVRGSAKRCTLLLRLTQLETRISIRKHVRRLTPCGEDELLDEIGRAAQALAGRAPTAAAGPRGARTLLPPPPAATGAAGAGASAPPPPAEAIGSLSVTGSPKGALVRVQGPPTFNGGLPLDTSLPLFPPQTVPAGEYRVTVSAPDHAPATRRQLIPALGTWSLAVDLKESTARLVLSGEPAGASTSVRCGPDLSVKPTNVSSEPFGLPAQPFEFVVPVGSCRVRASFVGWHDHEETVTLAGGESRPLHVKMRRVGAPRLDAKGIAWVPLPAGSFRMGSDTGAEDERPEHPVRVRAFEITQTETTTAQYAACVRAGACVGGHQAADACSHWDGKAWVKKPLPADMGGDQQPAACISWGDGQAFATWVGDGARLCSEAEWEYAARSGGRAQRYPWGDEPPTCQRAVMDDGGDGCALKRTWPVCSKPDGNTAQGLCDMAGNVFEWVADRHHTNYQGAPADGSAWVAGDSDSRMARGAGWYFNKLGHHVTQRFSHPKGFRSLNMGLRLCRSR